MRAISYKDQKIIGFGDLVLLCRIEDVETWDTNLTVKNDGVYVKTPPARLTPEETEVVTRHTTGNLNEPTLVFPCSINEFENFLETHCLYDCVPPFALLDWYLKKSGNDFRAQHTEELNPKTRTSLLRIVAMLDVASDLPDKPFKAADGLLAMLENKDDLPSRQTIAHHLKTARDETGYR